MKSNQSKSPVFKKTALAVAMTGTLAMVSTPSYAQDVIEEVVVTGLKGSLQQSTTIKKNATNFVDSISALDIGKFPDLNVAESLQRVSGVSIDRSGGVGQQVTVRGLGPQFNTVLVNGRQIANDSGGREFNFDVLAAEQITGASVYKSARADIQEGGIGATIVLDTARPLDKPGFYAVGSAKMINETLSGATTPAISGIVSNTFNDDTMGVLFSLAYQQRDVQINRIETAGWRPGLTISNNAGDTNAATVNVLHDDVYFPRNWDQIVDEQDRTRLNANLVFQIAPSEDLTITFDGSYNKFEIDSLATDLASWFEPDRVKTATIDEATRTVTKFSQDIDAFVTSGNPATDFVSHTRNRRDVTNTAFGINIDYKFNDNLVGVFDIATSTAKNDRAGQDRFNVIGIINNYTFDGTGSVPTVVHDGFSAGETRPSTSLLRLHYNEKGNRPTDEDSVSEVKADFIYTPEYGEVKKTVKFGAYAQQREKSQFQIFGSQCKYCGYGTVAPVDALRVFTFTANNFFPGLIDTFYAYDGDAYVNYLSNQGFPITTTLQNNRYTVNENIFSLYMDFTFEFDLGDMPVTINTGGRYSDTDIDADAIQAPISDVVPTTDLTLFANKFGTPADISEAGSYGNFLPSLNIKLELTDDLIFRAARYSSLTRPTLSQLSPATTFNEPRRQNLTAQGGNPTLEPFQAGNLDMAIEWYYGDANLVSMSFFNKGVSGFITSVTGAENFTLADRGAAVNGVIRCADALCATDAVLGAADVDEVATTEELNGSAEVYTVTRPQNGEAASITGYELSVTHIFESGFGIIANATFVDSNANYDPDSAQNLALEGIGDSQNLILFYEANTWQARIAYNNRDAFLRNFDNGSTGEPVNTEQFSQIDLSASYDINETFQVFLEGINITGEQLVQNGRYPTQVYNIEDNGSRYAVGVRASF